MAESTRRTRPVPTRSEPKRTWPQSFENSSRGSESDGETEPARAAGAHPPSGTRESVDGTVNDAYRLIDEYLRQGQRMAKSAWLPFQGNSGDNHEPSNAPARLLRAMGDMTMAWFEVVQQTAGGGQQRPGAGPVGTAGPFAAGKAPPPGGAPPASAAPPPGAAPPASAAPPTQPKDAATSVPFAAIKVTVQSSCPVEVSVEVTARPSSHQLLATELRCPSNDASPIAGVEVEVSAIDAAPTLRIIVPEGQPRGMYSGLLLEQESHRPCGIVSLSVL